MSPAHPDLAAGRWREMPLMAQMANIGGEVERFLNWKARGGGNHAERAFERALELLDLTLEDPKNRERLGEIVRLREVFVDQVEGGTLKVSSDESWRRYFLPFAVASRCDR